MKLSLYFYVFLRILRKIPEARVIFNFLKFQLNKRSKNTILNFHPVSIIISATKRCNFACEFCFVEDYMNKSEGRTGESVILKLN